MMGGCFGLLLHLHNAIPPALVFNDFICPLAVLVNAPIGVSDVSTGTREKAEMCAG